MRAQNKNILMACLSHQYPPISAIFFAIMSLRLFRLVISLLALIPSAAELSIPREGLCLGRRSCLTLGATQTPAKPTADTSTSR
jgi:hypothetical protein